MTGPEHYREAERLLEPGEHDWNEPELVARDIAIAQVHATLAVAAAVADGPAVMRPEDRHEWDRATGRLEGDWSKVEEAGR